MTPTFRLVAPVVGLVLSCSVADAQLLTAPPPHLTLTQVVEEYKRLGLPLLPTNAQLVRINWGRYIRNGGEGPAQERYELVYRISPNKLGGRTRYLEKGFAGVGLRELEFMSPIVIEETEPAPDALRGLSSAPGTEYLCLAIHSKERGWDGLAAASYSLALEKFYESKSYHSVIRELRVVAWLFWEGRATDRGTNREEALRRLKSLALEPDFLTPDKDQFVRNLEKTVAPRRSKPGTIEALIDDLTEYWHDPLNDLSPAEPASYWKLVELGFDAAPALIEHVNDDRLTRAWVTGFKINAAHKLTVGHLCSRLLFDLSAKTISGEYWEDRGDRLKADEAQKWFARAKKIGEEKWLLEHAIPVGDEGQIVGEPGRAESQIVRVIGAKFPNRLPAIYRALLKEPIKGALLDNCVNDYVNEIVASKLTGEQKTALLEEGAGSADFGHRLFALEGLARLDQSLLQKHLLATLRWAKTRLGRSDARFAARLVRVADSANDRACWEALAETSTTVGADFRTSLLWGTVPFGPPNDKGATRSYHIRFLMHFLNDRTVQIDEGESGDEIRDQAASVLAALFDLRARWEVDFYRPRHDPTLGPLARLFLRVAVWRTATRELAVPQ